MTFFAPLPDPEEDPVEEHDREWLEPGDFVVGGVVPVQVVLGESAKAAVIINGLTVDPGGVTFTVKAFQRRPPSPAELKDLRTRLGSRADHHDPLDQGLRVGVELADGTRLETSHRWGWHATDNDQYSLFHHGGGGGGGGRWEYNFRIEPAAPPGPIMFACVWPLAQIEESTHVVSANSVAEASAATQILWPDDPLQSPADDAPPHDHRHA